MELKVNDYQLPMPIQFNYEELKKEIKAKAEQYASVVYTEDQIKAAKADRAALNKLKKALNDERIRREKEYLQPFNEFKAQIAEIIKIIDEPVTVIDTQIKGYEEKQESDKKMQIEAFFFGACPFEWLKPEQIFNERWLNASVKMAAVEDEIKTRFEEIKKGFEILSNLPEFSFEATEEYKLSLDLNKAISEGKRLSEIAKRKAEQERLRAEMEADLAKRKAEQEAAANAAESVGEATFNNAPDITEQIPKQPKKYEICFRAFVTVEQANELKAFFDSRNIEFERI